MFFLYICLIASIASILNSQSINTENCGHRPLAVLNNKIVGGVKAIPGDWSWSVSIALSGRHFCGGVLINEQWVLSAATCFQSITSSFISRLTVDVGVHDILNKESWVKTSKVSKVIVHESFSINYLTNDIALIKLDSPITLDDKYYIPACVPDLDTLDYTSVNETAWLTGWGSQFFGGATTREKMQASMIVLPELECKHRYDYFYTFDRQICASEPYLNVGGCQGDSGGPFVRQMEDSRWYVIGLISFNINCGNGNVFTNVKYYIPWIKNIISTN